MIFGPKPESHILPTERRVVRVRPHWMSLWKVISQSIIVIFLLAGLNWLLSSLGDSVWVIATSIWCLQLIVLLYLIYHVYYWWEDRIMVTDRRFLRVRGVFTMTVDMMPITKVTDMTNHQSLIGRLFGYGTIRIESAGQMQALELIQYVPDPDIIYEAITKLVFGDKEQSGRLPRPRTGPFAGRRGSRAIDNPDADIPSTDDLSDEWPSR